MLKCYSCGSPLAGDTCTDTNGETAIKCNNDSCGRSNVLMLSSDPDTGAEIYVVNEAISRIKSK